MGAASIRRVRPFSLKRRARGSSSMACFSASKGASAEIFFDAMNGQRRRARRHADFTHTRRQFRQLIAYERERHTVDGRDIRALIGGDCAQRVHVSATLLYQCEEKKSVER